MTASEFSLPHRRYTFATLDRVHAYVAAQLQRYTGLEPESAAARPYLLQFASEQGWALGCAARLHCCLTLTTLRIRLQADLSRF